MLISRKILSQLLLAVICSTAFTAVAGSSYGEQSNISGVHEQSALSGSRIEIESDGPVVSVESSVLKLTSRGADDRTFMIYSIVGRLVKTVEVKSGNTETVELAAGCYVVRCGRWSKKVIVN